MNNNSELTDLIKWNARLIQDSEAMLDLPLHPKSVPQILKNIPSDKLANTCAAFSSSWENMITRLETYPLRPYTDLYCPPSGFTFVSFFQDEHSPILEQKSKLVSSVLYYPRVLLYVPERDPFKVFSELQYDDKENEIMRREELADLCYIAPLMKQGIFLYLPTQKPMDRTIGFPGYHAPDAKEFCFRENLDKHQLTYSSLTQSHLLFDEHESFNRYLNIFQGKLGIFPEFHGMIDSSPGVRVKTNGLFLPEKLMYEDLLSLREEACFENWRNTLQLSSQYAREWANTGFDSAYKFPDKLGDIFDQALSNIHKSRRESSYLNEVLTTPTGFASGYGGIILCEETETMTLLNLFSTGNKGKYLMKHFTCLLYEY